MTFIGALDNELRREVEGKVRSGVAPIASRENVRHKPQR
jgi:hypothetical protein